MKTSVKILFSLIFSIVLIVFTKAQESDYQIKSNFETQYQSIINHLNNATNTVVLDSLKDNIEYLREENKAHKSIIDIALYPKTFDNEIQALKHLAYSTEQKLLLIENQKERLIHLTREISNYKTEIGFLNERSDSLYKVISSSMLSEERLSKLIRSYRENLEKRDHLVIDIVDSLMFSYRGMSAIRFDESKNQINSGNIIRKDNPLTMIMNILDYNIDFTKSSNQALTIEDHLRMFAVQNHFEKAWNKVGAEMIENYVGTDKISLTKEIELKLKDWRISTSHRLWSSLDNYLEYNDIDLDAFDNNYSFFLALDHFLSTSSKKSKENLISAENFKNYQKFHAFWSTKVKNEWSSLIQETDVLTTSQISSIDEKLSNWEIVSRPIHPLIIILSVLTIVSVLAFFLVMYKVQ